MKDLLNWMQIELGLEQVLLTKLLSSVSLILVFFFIHILVTKVILQKLTDSRLDGHKVYYQWKKILGYIFFFLATIAVGRVWLEGFQAVTTFIGLISAGLTIALKDIVTDIAGWIFIIWKRPFQVGDRIEIGDRAGDVIDLEVFQFTLLEIAGNRIDAEQSTGRMIHVPNGQIFTESLANYTKGFDYIWNEIPILITFESSRVKAKEILTKILEEHAMETSKEAESSMKSASKKYMLLYSKLGPRVYTDIKDSGVLYTLRYLCNVQNVRDSIELISEDILEAFDNNNDIDFAYPTRRVFDNTVEGKGSRSSSPQP